MSHVFISYSGKDGDFACNTLQKRLESEGIKTWAAVPGIQTGEEWRQSIDEALRDAFALIVVISPNINEAPWVNYEWAFAQGHGIELIPLMYRDTPDMHPRLQDFYHENFTDYRNHPWEKLVQRVKKVAEKQSVPPEVRRAIEGLVEYEPDRRESALHALMDIGHSCVPKELARKLVNCQYTDTRRQIIDTLGQLRNPSTIPELIHALGDEDDLVCEAAVESLVAFGVDAVPDLREALRYESGPVRKLAAETLGRIADPDVICDLLHVLRDSSEDKYVREAAAQALVDINDDALPGMLNALREADADNQMRYIVVQTLGRTGYENVLPDTLRVLQDEDESMRCVALEALGNIANPAAVPDIVEHLKDEHHSVREAAAGALGQIGSDTAVPKLLCSLQDEHVQVRYACIEALGKIGSPMAIQQLLKALHDEDEYVRSSAGKVLVSIVNDYVNSHSS